MFKEWFQNPRLFLDYAAGMPVFPGAREAFVRAVDTFANPSALHHEGVCAQEVLHDARARVARTLGCKQSEIIFTSGGTEGNNLALRGVVAARERAAHSKQEMHIVVSGIEHPSVLESAAALAQEGVHISYVAPNARGEITAEAVVGELTPQTVCVVVGWANGEIGTVQPLSSISRAIRAYESVRDTRITFISDFGLAPHAYAPHVHTLGVDIAVLDASKLGGVRGIGALYVARGTPLAPILFGGGQEGGLRPGTEALPLAVGFAAACEEVGRIRAREAVRVHAIRESFLLALKARMPEAVVNGTGKEQLPHILNVSIPGIDNEYITLALDRSGIAVATKSSCKEGERESHVVRSLCDEPETWHASTSLRISFGSGTRKQDGERFAATLRRVTDAYRAQRPNTGATVA